MTEPQLEANDEDHDVFAERMRVANGRANGDILKIHNLTKVRLNIKYEKSFGSCGLSSVSLNNE